MYRVNASPSAPVSRSHAPKRHEWWEAAGCFRPAGAECLTFVESSDDSFQGLCVPELDSPLGQSLECLHQGQPASSNDHQLLTNTASCNADRAPAAAAAGWREEMTLRSLRASWRRASASSTASAHSHTLLAPSVL